MRIFLIFIFSLFLLFSCTKKNQVAEAPPSTKTEAIKVYQEALQSLKDGQYFIARKKFDQSESLLPQTGWAAKSALMSSYCLYSMNLYDEAIVNLKRFIKVYPADSNVGYAHYLVAIIYYEKILDEKKDIEPLILSKKTIEEFLTKFPDTDYAIDLKFKLDLIINQMAAKELYIAKYYISVQKWIPAINRLKNIVDNYNQTIFIEEALHRLVEIYYLIGLENKAKKYAKILGYNYNSSQWFEQSYKILNKDYEIIRKKDSKPKKESIIQRIIKKIK